MVWRRWQIAAKEDERFVTFTQNPTNRLKTQARCDIIPYMDSGKANECPWTDATVTDMRRNTQAGEEAPLLRA